MDKKVSQEVLERSEGICELCECNYMCEMHHIIKGRGKRKQHETKESIIMLCWYCHKGPKGIHGGNKELDLKLKIELQEKYKNQGHSEDEIRTLMGGRLYFS